jgi:hypothetical protein
VAEAIAGLELEMQAKLYVKTRNCCIVKAVVVLGSELDMCVELKPSTRS